MRSLPKFSNRSADSHIFTLEDFMAAGNMIEWNNCCSHFHATSIVINEDDSVMSFLPFLPFTFIVGVSLQYTVVYAIVN